MQLLSSESKAALGKDNACQLINRQSYTIGNNGYELTQWFMGPENLKSHLRRLSSNPSPYPNEPNSSY